MRISEMLMAIASWLESKDNEALLLSEYNEECMEKVATSCIKAADILKECADQVDLMEDKRRLSIAETKQLLQTFSATPFKDNVLTVSLFDGDDKLVAVIASSEEVISELAKIELPADITATVAITAGNDGIEEISKMAGVFDGSEDEGLKKQAGVIDELLLTLAAPPNWIANFKAAQQKKIDEIKRLYQEPSEKLHEVIGVEEAKKAIDKSEYTKVRRPLEAPLSMRTCPDHFCSMARVGEDSYQCPLDKKCYNWLEGFKTEKGDIIPSGSVQEQTKLEFPVRQMFETREERMHK